MKCPACQVLMCPLDCPDYHWCWKCGCVVGPANNPSYPAQAERHADLRRCLADLLWPNVPSADDVALMVRMCGTTDTQKSAMELVDRLRAAQSAARGALDLDEGR